MSAPPRPVWAETAQEVAEAEAAERAAWDRALRAAARAQRPAARAPRAHAYARPGDPRGLVLTARDWASYDEFNALMDSMEAKRNRLRAAAGLAPVMLMSAGRRRMW